MKKSYTLYLLLILVVLVVILTLSLHFHYTDMTRDIQYENYCDSIWECDSDYYLEVLTETDEYMDYLEKHGAWWNE